MLLGSDNMRLSPPSVGGALFQLRAPALPKSPPSSPLLSTPTPTLTLNPPVPITLTSNTMSDPKPYDPSSDVSPLIEEIPER